MKPNWVLHFNQSGQGVDCLLTHVSVIDAVLEYVALAHPQSVIVGDAPVHGCDFKALRRATAIEEVIARYPRKNGSSDGGDCYPGRSWVKRQAEEAADAANRLPPGLRQRALYDVAQGFQRLAARVERDGDIEGSW